MTYRLSALSSLIKDITYRQTYVPSRTLTLTKVAIQSVGRPLSVPFLHILCCHAGLTSGLFDPHLSAQRRRFSSWLSGATTREMVDVEVQEASLPRRTPACWHLASQVLPLVWSSDHHLYHNCKCQKWTYLSCSSPIWCWVIPGSLEELNISWERRPGCDIG